MNEEGEGEDLPQPILPSRDRQDGLAAPGLFRVAELDVRYTQYEELEARI